jgi:hypothetical protein
VYSILEDYYFTTQKDLNLLQKLEIQKFGHFYKACHWFWNDIVHEGVGVILALKKFHEEKRNQREKRKTYLLGLAPIRTRTIALDPTFGSFDLIRTGFFGESV